MAAPSRGPKISRRGWLLAGLVAPLFPVRAADSLIITFDGDYLHVSSLGVHFLRGKSLSRLKDGSTVIYIATVELFRDQFVNLIKRLEFKFVVSYDVIGTGDQFQVVVPGPKPFRRVNLSQSEAETWCFEHVIVPMLGIAPDQQFWLRLDLRTAVPKLSSVLGESGIIIDIVEFFTPGSNELQTFTRGPLVRPPAKGSIR
jgi:hypothetical protein